jgi:hypothetical protein
VKNCKDAIAAQQKEIQEFSNQINNQIYGLSSNLKEKFISVSG